MGREENLWRPYRIYYTRGYVLGYIHIFTGCLYFFFQFRIVILVSPLATLERPSVVAWWGLGPTHRQRALEGRALFAMLAIVCKLLELWFFGYKGNNCIYSKIDNGYLLMARTFFCIKIYYALLACNLTQSITKYRVFCRQIAQFT